MNDTTERPTIKRVSWIIWGVLAALILFLASAFSRTWAINQALQTELHTLAPMLTAIADEQLTLEARLEYVQSDTYVESWAREHAGMTLAGETLVVPIIPTATPTLTPRPTEMPSPTPTALPFWQRLFSGFGGKD